MSFEQVEKRLLAYVSVTREIFPLNEEGNTFVVDGDPYMYLYEDEHPLLEVPFIEGELNFTEALYAAVEDYFKEQLNQAHFINTLESYGHSRYLYSTQETLEFEDCPVPSDKYLIHYFFGVEQVLDVTDYLQTGESSDAQVNDEEIARMYAADMSARISEEVELKQNPIEFSDAVLNVLALIGKYRVQAGRRMVNVYNDGVVPIRLEESDRATLRRLGYRLDIDEKAAVVHSWTGRPLPYTIHW